MNSITIEVALGPDQPPTKPWGGYWYFTERAMDATPPSLNRLFVPELPVSEHVVGEYYSSTATIEQAERVAELIEQYGQAQGCPLVTTIHATTYPDRDDSNGAVETCWECGTEIAPHTGILDAMGWAHRSCIGA